MLQRQNEVETFMLFLVFVFPLSRVLYFGVLAGRVPIVICFILKKSEKASGFLLIDNYLLQNASTDVPESQATYLNRKELEKMMSCFCVFFVDFCVA